MKKCPTGQSFIFKEVTSYKIHTLTSEDDCSIVSRKIRMTPLSQNVWQKIAF